MSLRTNRTYILLSILLFFLSIAGVYLYIQNIKAATLTTLTPPGQTSDLPSSPVSPTLSPTPSEAILPSEAPLPTVTPLQDEKEFVSTDDNFSVIYKQDRQVYQDKQSYGNRYTFYRDGGNFAIHVGRDWSWVYPNRQFDADFTLSGQPAFRYDIEAQTIVDIQSAEVFYTLQCIHSGDPDLKNECESFLKNFKLL